MLESAQELLGPMDVCDHAGSDPDTISMGFGCGSCTKTGISSADARERYQEAARQQWYSNCVARHRSCVGVTMLRKQLALNLRAYFGPQSTRLVYHSYWPLRCEWLCPLRNPLREPSLY